MVNTPCQATVLLEAMRSARQKSFADRDALRVLAKNHDLEVAFIDISEGGLEKVDIVVFRDGSCFCATIEGHYQPWPFELCHPESLSYDTDEIGPVLENAGDLLPPSAWTGRVMGRDVISENATIEAWARRIATELPDPPEALRDLVVPLEQDLYWEDRSNQEEAQTLVALFAQYYVPTACTLTIRAHHDAGRPPIQKRRDKNLLETMRQYSGFGSDYEREAMYNGRAYAEIEEAEAMDYKLLAPINAALAWFSAEVLARLGRPVGWETDYNDGARDRQSGYSAYAEAVELDLAQALSNHERIRASLKLQEFLQANDLARTFEEVRRDLGLAPLFTAPSEDV